MKLTEEKGVTLIALVTTIVILLILTSIGVNSGISVLNSAKFSQFKEELKILQTKVNEVSQTNETNIGEELTETQKDILNITAISDIIYDGKLEGEKLKIQNGFKYFNNDRLKNDLELEGIKRDYLINFEYRYVICCNGVEYNGTTYYMANQIENTYYNVTYKDKNEKDRSFEVTATKEDNRWKIEISNIVYNGYIDNWEVKYKLKEDTYWKTSNGLIFYLDEEGIYEVNVRFKDEVDLGVESVKLISDGLIADKVKNNTIKVGDYVKYEPDEVKETDTSYTNLISDLQTYSGNTDTTKNTSSTITQENLNWRVLDKIKDENGKDCVRLISELPTESKVSLYGPKGYNNAVYLLDNICNTLYYNLTYANKVQSLKIEDIQKYLTYDYTQYENLYVDTGKYGGGKIYDKYIYYPNIFIKEKTGNIDGVNGTELDLSEQTELVNEEKTQAQKNIKVTQTYWNKKLLEADFKNEKYYNLFIKEDEQSNDSICWISSRCVHASSEYAHFGIYCIKTSTSGVSSYDMCRSTGVSDGNEYSIRPVITLNSTVKIDAENSGDGKQAENAWILKNE